MYLRNDGNIRTKVHDRYYRDRYDKELNNVFLYDYTHLRYFYQNNVVLRFSNSFFCHLYIYHCYILWRDRDNY